LSYGGTDKVAEFVFIFSLKYRFLAKDGPRDAGPRQNQVKEGCLIHKLNYPFWELKRWWRVLSLAAAIPHREKNQRDFADLIPNTLNIFLTPWVKQRHG
jgi:hypothetical protein